MDCWSGAKILCDFWDTKINTDNVILTTRYRSEDIPGFVADPEEIKKYVHELVNNAHMAATDNKIRDTILINQKFDYLYAENGRLKAVVVDNNGEPQVTDVTPDKPYSQSLITDGQGDTLVVSKKGQVMGVKEYKFAGDDRHLLNEYHRQLDSLGEWQINFLPDTKHQTYAFDQLGSGDHGIFATDEYYPKSGSYDFRYKSVECGKSDRVVVDFGSYPEKDSVIFKDKYGVKLKVVDKNILTFTGVSTADTNYIYAYRGDKKIGKLFLNTYQPKKYQVVFVKVNKGAPKLKEKEVKEYLNKVYNQCAVQFEIISTDTITIKDLTTFSHGGSGILSVYNEDQKKVLRAYDKNMKDNTYYLFFVDNVTDKKDGSGTPVSGYMPRGYNAGFIYDGGSPHTIAHELGHGVAGLEHVFSDSKASGKTANLMDYATGEQLWHFQWDQIQDPGRVWMKWNKDESEGENLENIEIYEFPNEDCKIVYYLFSAYNSQILRDYLENGNIKEAIHFLHLWTETKFIQSDYSTNLYNGLADNVDDEAYNKNLALFKSLFKDYKFVGLPFQNSKGTRNAIAVYYIWGFTNAESLEELRNHNYAKIYEPYYIDRLVIPFDNNQKYDNCQDDNKEHQETVLRWIQKKAGVFQEEYSISAEGGFASTAGAQANVKCGVAVDFYSNIGIYGDLSAFCYFVGHSAHTETLRNNPVKALDDFKYGQNKSCIFDDPSISVGVCQYWHFRMNNLKDVYGPGYTSTVSLPLLKIVCLNVSLSWDSKGKFLGLGGGGGISAGPLSLPLSFSHIESVNRGLIITMEEFLTLVGKIRNVEFDFSKFDIGFATNNVVENGIERKVLQIVGGPVTIDTKIEIVPNDDPEHNTNNRFYFISKNANLRYSQPNDDSK